MSRSFLWYQLPAFLWAALIFTVSSIPGDNLPNFEFKFMDKLEHAVAYGILGLLTSRALVNQGRFPNWRRNFFWIAVIIGTLYGISDEFHQLTVRGRRFDIYDAVADAVGAFLGASAYRWLLQNTSSPGYTAAERKS